MKKSGILVILLLIVMISFSDCEITCKWIGVTCSDNIHIIRISEDPQTGKSLTIDCSGYGVHGFFKKAYGIPYTPFSDVIGRGCRAVD